MKKPQDIVELVLKQLFVNECDRKAVRAMAFDGLSAYEAEKKYSASASTGNRKYKRYQAHLDYLESLGLDVSTLRGVKVNDK